MSAVDCGMRAADRALSVGSEATGNHDVEATAGLCASSDLIPLAPENQSGWC